MINYDSDRQTDNLRLFNRAFEYHEMGRYPEAEEMYRSLLTHIKDNWYLHFNLALLLFETDRAEEALDHYLAAASLTTSSNDLYYNLAICQKQCGLYNQCIESYHRALELDPDDTDSLYNLAGCYHTVNKFEDAINCYVSLLKKEPQHQSAMNNLAYIYHKTGRIEQAESYYKQLLNVNPEHASADHMLASISGNHRSSAPLSYIKEVFDNYSDHYEDSLTNKLQYSLPDKLHTMVSGLSGQKQFNQLLDLGCGTGLVGESFRKSVRTLHGVDLSANMIKIADNKKIYDLLITNNIDDAITDIENDCYDLLIAADVFTYIGEINGLFKRLYEVGTSDCHLYFSVEDVADDTGQIVLRNSGRFAHSRSYIKQTADTTGWHIFKVESINLRKERGNWIKGAVYAMKKYTT
jgi:predicted TPR repeat methyltransferase